MGRMPLSGFRLNIFGDAGGSPRQWRKEVVLQGYLGRFYAPHIAFLYGSRRDCSSEVCREGVGCATVLKERSHDWVYNKVCPT